MRTRTLIRTAIAFVLLLGALVAALAIALASPTAYTPFLILIVLLAGFWSLGLTATPTAPLRPLRITVAISSVIAIGMIIGLLQSVGHSDWATLVLIVTATASSIAAAVVASRPGEPAITLLAIPGIVGLLAASRLVALSRVSGGLAAAGVSEALAYIIGGAAGAAWLIAPWHAWRAVARDQATSRVPSNVQ